MRRLCCKGLLKLRQPPSLRAYPLVATHHGLSSPASTELDEDDEEMERMRYFVNPYADFDSNSSAPVVDRDRVKNQLLETAKIVFSKRDSERDGGIYVGAAGITYAYLHMRHALNKEENKYFLELAQKFYENHMREFESENGRDQMPDARSVGFLLGQAGVYAVGAVLGRTSGNESLVKQCLNNYGRVAPLCKPLDFLKRGSDELFVGRAGYLLGAIWLHEQIGPSCHPVGKEDLFEIWSSIVESGRRYAASNHSPCPLMYAYHHKEYLGAAHGLCAILQVLLSFPDFLKRDPMAEKDIKTTVDFYLTLQTKDGNFPSSMGEIGTSRRDERNELVHWCHGAPGAIYLFAKAYLVYGDERYLNSCKHMGELIWRKGLLKKGPGICHGVAGNGYVFLLLHRLLKEPENSGKNLYRASKFAAFLTHPLFQKARTPDCPYSLYEGLAGTCCYLADLTAPQIAHFPFFNVFFQYTF